MVDMPEPGYRCSTYVALSAFVVIVAVMLIVRFLVPDMPLPN
jgi:hypothetical protein